MLGVSAGEEHLEDNQCLKLFYDKLVYDPVNQNYEVGLPWKPNSKYLQINIKMAIAPMVQLQRKFMANPEFTLAYQKKVRELHI